MEVTESTASFSEFATLRGFKKSYVTELKAAGRLVLTSDSKRVRVAESIQRIADTKDPSKTGVARRHEAERANRAADAGESHTPAPASFDSEQGGRVGSTYQAARAVKEQYLAREAKRAFEVAIGKLLPADQVAAVIAAATATLRMRFEAMPDILAPQLAAANEESTVRAILAETIEHTLEETARHFAGVTKIEKP